jgi:hypothetical protein
LRSALLISASRTATRCRATEVLVDQDHRPARGIHALEDLQPSLAHLGRLHDVHHRPIGAGIDPRLAHPRPRPAVPRARRSAGRGPTPGPGTARYAATSRADRVPSGKSQSGRSPRTGLYTQRTSHPRCDRHRAGARSHSMRRAGAPRPSVPRHRRGHARAHRCRSTGGWTGSSAAAVPIRPRADVTGGVQRLGAERAGRPARGDHGTGALGEGPGPRRGRARPCRVSGPSLPSSPISGPPALLA